MSLEEVKALGKQMLTADKNIIKLRTKRIAAETLEKEAKRERELMSVEQIKLLRKLDSTGHTFSVGKRKLSIEIRESVHPSVSDRAKLNAYMIETESLDMMQSRLNSAAIKARWEDGIKVPGVAKFTKRVVVIKEIGK